MIQNILAPTDFSACANNAVELASAFAKQLDASLFLYTNLEIPDQWPQMEAAQRNNYPEALQTIHNTEVLFRDIKTRHAELKIKTLYSGGKLFENIKAIVEDKSIDLVVMGSHGASGKNEFFLGSNTQKVLRQLHSPMLIVKNEMAEIKFDQAIFASSFNEHEKIAFRKFLQMASILKVQEIHLLSIHTDSFFNAPYVVTLEAMKDFAELSRKIPCQTHIYRDFTIDRGIRNFAEEVQADLLVISNHYRRPLKRMLAGSNVEALVNHAELPVLSIDFED